MNIRAELELAPIDPLPADRVAQHLGIAVHDVTEIPGLDAAALHVLTVTGRDSWSALTIATNSKVLILLNPSQTGGRPASNLMHELAHIFLDHKPARVDVTEDDALLLKTYDREQEDEAAWLSGCLLLPRPALVEIRRRGISTAAAVRVYGVSPHMLQYRLNVTGVEKQFGRSRSFVKK